MKMLHAALSVFVCLGGLRGQQNADIANANQPVQRIGADDLISVAVYDSPELTRTVRVSDDGQIRLPMLRRAIPVAGLMPRELEASIGDALRAEQILIDPVVTVTVVEYRSRPVSVAGAVKHPVTFQATGNITLLDALTRADGLATEAGSEILVTHAMTNGKTVTQRIAIRELFEGEHPELNQRLTGGEEIRVPEAARIYALGNIKNPGAFSLKDGKETSVLKVLALAGGLAPFSSKQAYIYRPKPGAQDKDEIPVALNHIIARKSPDVALKADDIFYVPDDKGRRLSAAALEKIVGFGAATTSGLLIWR